jgi:transposase, IS6 family
MMQERGVEVDHVTLYRWVIKYAPDIEKKLRWYRQSSLSLTWKVDEIYVKVKGSGKTLSIRVEHESRSKVKG